VQGRALSPDVEVESDATGSTRPFEGSVIEFGLDLYTVLEYELDTSGLSPSELG
jgi:hypothetical protein